MGIDSTLGTDSTMPSYLDMMLTWNLLLFLETIICIFLQFSKGGRFEGVKINFNLFWVGVLSLH